jgi:two-component system chemotaxis response regulator CheB
MATDALGAEVAAVVRGTGSPSDPDPIPDPQHGRTADMERAPTEVSELGVPAALGCPECQGGMFERRADETVTYACHVGHTWSAQTLLEAEEQASEGAIYHAAAKLMEMAAVHRKLAELAPDPAVGSQHLRSAEAAEERAARIRDLATEDPAGEVAAG